MTGPDEDHSGATARSFEDRCRRQEYPDRHGARNSRMDSIDIGPQGPFEARYVAFLETISHLRPRLHRYCARMTGSLTDGEDVVQDALFQAYRKLDTFDDSR